MNPDVCTLSVVGMAEISSITGAPGPCGCGRNMAAQVSPAGLLTENLRQVAQPLCLNFLICPTGLIMIIILLKATGYC